MDWRLRRADEGDAPALAMVAAASFLETFAGILNGPDIVAHCARKSGIAQFATWAKADDTVLTVAEHPQGAAPVGYTVLTAPDFPIEIGADDIELRRIYALSLTRGTGIGAALMKTCLEDARTLGKTRLLLGVLGENRLARDFYERQGFTLAGERQFQVGDSLFDDVIYARAL